MGDLKYEIVRSIAVLSKATSGWTCELNLISWRGQEPVYDIRDWAPGHERPGKGKTLTKEQAAALSKALKIELCRKEA